MSSYCEPCSREKLIIGGKVHLYLPASFGRHPWESPGAPSGRALWPPGLSLVRAQINYSVFILLLGQTTSITSSKLYVSNLFVALSKMTSELIGLKI